jgi:hypothetical protein
MNGVARNVIHAGADHPSEDLSMKIHSIVTSALGVVALAACASTPGAQPTDMSTVAHEQAASQHDSEATTHAAQYDPNAQAQQTAGIGCASLYSTGKPCWTSATNPTQQHLDDAKKHHKMAADHRAAAEALRTAEAQSCSGISDDDRDISPFYHREDITTVEPAYLASARGKGDPSSISGAVVTFRAVKGLTPEWLQRVVNCHIARNNAMGNDMPEMAYCPLEPKGVTATVSSAGDGFAVRIEAKDPKTAQEVLRRAQALKKAG